MANPTTRADFISYCLRRLGAPVINIDVDPTQLDDRVDDALKFYYDYHWDGTTKTYYKHQMTQTDIDNGYIQTPESIIGVVSIFDIGSAISSGSGMFSIQYQIALNDLYAFSGVDLIPYWMTMENLQFISEILVGHQPIRYNRNQDRLYIDMDLAKIGVGQYVIAEAYEFTDPTLYPDVWGERWLQKYATALIKRQWGENLKKFSGVALPGGVTMNGQTIYDEAVEEVEAMEEDLISNSMHTAFLIG
jgi:hypothetical protein